MYHLVKIFLILLTISSCQRPERPGNPLVLAIVNGSVIKEDSLRYRVNLEKNKFSDSPLDKKGSLNLKKEVLERMIKDIIIMDWGKKQGIVLNDTEKAEGLAKLKKGYTDREFEIMLKEKNISLAQWSEMSEQNLTIEKVLREALYKNINVTPAEIEAYYKKNRDRYRTEERVHVRHIVTDKEEEANNLRARIIKGENFAELAILHSLSPDRSRGGDLGYFAKGTYPAEFDETCFKLAPGEVSQVVKSPYGYHIFKLLDKKASGSLDISEVLPQIESEILKQKMEESFTPWYKTLKDKSQVQVNEEALEAMEL